MNRIKSKYKWIVIGTAIAMMAVVLIGIAIYNTPSNRLDRQLALGQKYLVEQDYEQAVVEFDKAIQIDPMNVEAYIGKAAAYESMGDYDSAVETLESGYLATSENADIKAQLIKDYVVAGQAKTEEGAYEEGLTIYDRLLELDRENETVLRGLRECLNKYFSILLEEERYDEITALIEKYADAATGIEFQAILEEIELRRKIARGLIVWEDELMERAVREYLDKPEGEIYKSEIEDIVQVDIGFRGVLTVNNDMSAVMNGSNYITLNGIQAAEGNIQTINDLKYFVSISSLRIEGMGISDISALSELTNLTELNLYSNQISDISSLRGLTKLEMLELSGNKVSDIDALRGLMNLKTLALQYNEISDITPLEGLINLEGLFLDENNVSDITVLRGLINLEILYLNDNAISDISALSGLTKMVWLHLGKNNINDVSALSGMTSLEMLFLTDNHISEVEELNGLRSLQFLYLDGTSVTDYTPVSFVPYVYI